MSFNQRLVYFFLLISSTTFGQIKIGDNPQNISSFSVLELESTSRAFVLTRINSTQMNAITPLQGALIYNTDSKCVHYYDGAQWLNLCEALTSSGNISLVDNGDGTYTFSDADNNITQLNTLNESLAVESGNLILTDSAGNSVSVELQDLNEQTFTTDAIINTFPTIFITQDANGTNFNFEVGVIDGESIQDGSITRLDLAPNSVTSGKLSENSVTINAMANDAVGSSEIINGSIQPIDIGPGSTNQFLTTNSTGAVQWVDHTDFVSADGVSYDPIDSGLAANSVKLALDELAVNSSDNQNLTAATLSGTNELRIDIENGASTTVNLSSLEESADIATLQAEVNQNKVDAEAAIALKENAVNKSSDNTFATADNVNFPTQLAVKTYVDTQVATVTTDDDITAVSFDGTDLTVEEGATSFSADLSSLEESADITAVQTNLDTHITADGDLNDQNEIELPIGGTSGQILSTDGAGIYSWINDNGGTDEQNLIGAALDPSDLLTIDIENGTSTNVSLASLEESADITAVQTNLDTHIAADEDINSSNEIQDLSITGTTLNITNNPTPNSIDIAAPEPWRNADDTPATNTSTTINYPNGNVGLGITTPDERLHVAGNMRLDGTFEDKDGEAGAAGQILSSTVTGTDCINPPTIVAMGKVDPGATPLTRTNSFVTTVINNSPGNYTVTMSGNLNPNYVIQLSLFNAGAGYSIEVIMQTLNSFSVQIYNAINMPNDASWYFTIFDF